ncbi:MAG: recO [Thermoleophilia bacterium]|nr:recO [Thermoleophilia bacterium]
MAAADTLDAIVLRTMRYGEADVIAHVHTRTLGTRGVIAKGARKPASRLGTRLEPFLTVRLTLVASRGDLATVRNVDIVDAHEHLRASWQAQQLGAPALDLVQRLSIDGEANEPVHHLLHNFLGHLDAAAADPTTIEARGRALLAAFELKLLHAGGFAPQLAACVRCGDPDAIVAFDADDGGVVCIACRVPSDRYLSGVTHQAAVELTRDSLSIIRERPLDELPSAPAVRAVRTDIVTAMAAAHAGISRRGRG